MPTSVNPQPKTNKLDTLHCKVSYNLIKVMDYKKEIAHVTHTPIYNNTKNAHKNIISKFL